MEETKNATFNVIVDMRVLQHAFMLCLIPRDDVILLLMYVIYGLCNTCVYTFSTFDSVFIGREVLIVVHPIPWDICKIKMTEQ